MDLELFLQNISQAFAEYIGGIIHALPSIAGGLLLLLIGWGLARLLRALVQRMIRSTGLHSMAERGGLGRLFGSLGGLAMVVGGLVYWLIQLFFILASAKVMDLQLVTEGIHRFFAYVPVLLTAAGIFVFGVWLGEKVQTLTTTLSGSVGLTGGKIIGRLLFGIIVLFMSITAMNMAGIDTTLITSNILLLVGGVLVAFSVAYGLAARDILGNILSSYYGKDRFAPGMHVRIGADEGVIERIDGVSVALRTKDRLILLPSKVLTSERIEVLDEVTGTEP